MVAVVFAGVQSELVVRLREAGLVWGSPLYEGRFFSHGEFEADVDVLLPT